MMPSLIPSAAPNPVLSTRAALAQGTTDALLQRYALTSPLYLGKISDRFIPAEIQEAKTLEDLLQRPLNPPQTRLTQGIAGDLYEAANSENANGPGCGLAAWILGGGAFATFMGMITEDSTAVLAIGGFTFAGAAAMVGGVAAMLSLSTIGGNFFTRRAEKKSHAVKQETQRQALEESAAKQVKARIDDDLDLLLDYWDVFVRGNYETLKTEAIKDLEKLEEQSRSLSDGRESVHATPPTTPSETREAAEITVDSSLALARGQSRIASLREEIASYKVELKTVETRVSDIKRQKNNQNVSHLLEQTRQQEERIDAAVSQRRQSRESLTAESEALTRETLSRQKAKSEMMRI